MRDAVATKAAAQGSDRGVPAAPAGTGSVIILQYGRADNLPGHLDQAMPGSSNAAWHSWVNHGHDDRSGT